MNMKSVFEAALNGTFDLSDMLGKIDTHHIAGNLSDADREELIRKAREKADPMGGVDIRAMLMDHENRLRTLEDAGKTDSTEDVTVPEYKSGTWYKAGDKVLFDGKVYVCTAPNGYIRAWSPADYPDHWALVE